MKHSLGRSINLLVITHSKIVVNATIFSPPSFLFFIFINTTNENEHDSAMDREFYPLQEYIFS
jgi:hypothetical protein